MPIGFWFTLLVINLLTVIVTSYVIRYRQKITCMTGMMIAMIMGMMVGITGGTVVGMVFSGNLFSSTIIAGSLGMLAGIITGAPIGIMPVLDGMVSGLMGGMMGAMLGDMLALNTAEMMVKILMVLFVGVILILFYMLVMEINNGRIPRLLRSPLMMALVVVLFFLIYNQLGNVLPNKQNEQINKHQHIEIN